MAEDRIEPEDVHAWLAPVSERQAVSLAELTPGEFASELAAMIDALLERFGKVNCLPSTVEEEGEDLFEAVLGPLVFGRALSLTGGNKSQAGKMFQKGIIDTTKDRHQRTVARYKNHWKSWIDESWVSRRRRTES